MTFADVSSVSRSIVYWSPDTVEFTFILWKGGFCILESQCMPEHLAVPDSHSCACFAQSADCAA